MSGVDAGVFQEEEIEMIFCYSSILSPFGNGMKMGLTRDLLRTYMGLREERMINLFPA